MPHGALTGARAFEIPDSFFTGTDTTIDYNTLRDHESFRPQAITISTSSNTTEQTNGYATVRGILWGENDTHVKSWLLNLRQAHGLAFRKIWRVGTTARGLKLISEV
jgi:hypothetical protein